MNFVTSFFCVNKKSLVWIIFLLNLLTGQSFLTRGAIVGGSFDVSASIEAGINESANSFKVIVIDLSIELFILCSSI